MNLQTYETRLRLLPCEEFRPIPGLEGYEASNLGRIKSLAYAVERRNRFGNLKKFHYSARILAGWADSRGYIRVSLRSGRESVHRLVLLTFVGQCPEGFEACHENGNPSDNALTNLRWGTHLANCDDRERHGRNYRGMAHKSTKFGPEIVAEIRRGSLCASEAFRRYRMSSTSFYRIKRREART